jgi:uroporphyrinogen decarboxylase
MNKIDRVRAMLRGAEVDRVPAGFWFHFAPEFKGGEAMARKHIEYYRATDFDILKVMNDTGYAPIGTVSIQRPEDWAKLEPTPLSDAHFQSHIEGLKRIVEVLGKEVLIMTTAFNPYHEAVTMIRASSPTGAMPEDKGREIFVQHARTAPELLTRALQIIAEDQARFFRACITEGGIGGIYFSAQGGERAMMSDAEHARFLKPYDVHVLREVGLVAEFIVGHFCGKSLNLARFADYPVQLANWAYQSDNLSLSQGKALFGGKSVLGGLDERGPLVYGPREALRAEAEKSLAEMGTRGFMLGAGCTVPGDVDLNNLIYARSLLAR